MRTLAQSYAPFPVGSVVQTGQWFNTLMQAAAEIFVIGWKIALPVFIVTLVMELSVAFIARMQPQISTIVVTAPLRLYVGFMVLGASLAFLPKALGDAFNLIVMRK
jgi:flagellar biosynthetic protein FliR